MSIFSMFFETQQSQIGVLYLDVLVSEELALPSDVTKYPVEDGTEDISDHITCNNEELSINGSISASSSFGMLLGGGCQSKLIDAIDQLRQMHLDRKLITITTGLGQYEDMGFTSLKVTRNNGADKGGNWLDIQAQMRKVKKVALKEADLPPDKAADDGSGGKGAKGKTGTTERRSGKSGTSSDSVPETAAYKAVKGTGAIGPKQGFTP